VAGRYLLNPLFQLIAGTGAKEAMIAAALFVVLGAGYAYAGGRPVDGDGRLSSPA
jgi:Kef-type K+ transport system membrane component KefB